MHAYCSTLSLCLRPGGIANSVLGRSLVAVLQPMVGDSTQRYRIACGSRNTARLRSLRA